MASNGTIAAFRNRTEDEIRDIYVSRVDNGKWTEPEPLMKTTGGLQCAVNGTMLSARGRDVVVAWSTVKGDVGHAYAAFSADTGRTRFA